MTRSLGLCAGFALPGLIVRATGLDVPSPVAIVLFGAAVVAAAFALAWAAEAAEVDISGGLAIAVLAVIAVLPEYAVDLYFAHAAGSNPDYTSYAAANMTGSNRLLLGLGWSTVALVSLAIASRRSKRTVRSLLLDSGHRRELGFLALATVIALAIPVSGQIHLALGILLLAVFGYYLWQAARSDHDDPELVGPAARIASLPTGRRRSLVVALFGSAAATILVCAEPFAEALVHGGGSLGIDEFLLVQWLAPLASEAPEFIVAILFATRGRGAAAIGLLLSAKVNQWTLLVGSLPIAYAAGGGSTALPLDARQVEEFLLTAAQTVLGIAILLSLRFPRWAAWTLLALFAVQFAIPGQTGRHALSAGYLALAIVASVNQRHQLWPTLTAPFRHRPSRPSGVPELELSGSS